MFTKERLNCDSITYLSIGDRPFEKYTLNFQNGIEKLREFWPAEIKGIDPEGTLFEKESGKKLSYDADVEIGREYYLLKRGYINRKSFSGMRIQEVMQKRIGWETWTLYVVSASAFNEEAARFYLQSLPSVKMALMIHCTSMTRFPCSVAIPAGRGSMCEARNSSSAIWLWLSYRNFSQKNI